MNTNLMRKELKNITKYKYSQSWIDRVNAMPEKQMMAIYFSFRKRGIL